MHKIVIIGGGFAGLSAIEYFRKFRNEVEVTLISKKETFDFLPLLPDVIGRKISPRFLIWDLNNLKYRYGFRFIPDEVLNINCERKMVESATKTLSYDDLIIASGLEPNFYGLSQIQRNAYPLNSVQDALGILSILEQKGQDLENIVIAGGGYTGIAIASQVWRYFIKRRTKKRIIIIENTSSVLGSLPEWMKNYVLRNLKSMGIQVWLNKRIEACEDQRITFAGGETLDSAICIWCAGGKTSRFISGGSFKKDAAGRIIVDDYLQANEACFVAGDAAHVVCNGRPLRASVKFSLMEGQCAAQNIMRLSRHKEMRAFKPLDLGFVIPLANSMACGHILSWDMKGYLPLFLHYLMCMYRTRGGMGKQKGILKDLLLSYLK